MTSIASFSDTFVLFVCFVVHRLPRRSSTPGPWLLSVARPKATDGRHARDGQDVRRTKRKSRPAGRLRPTSILPMYDGHLVRRPPGDWLVSSWQVYSPLRASTPELSSSNHEGHEEHEDRKMTSIASFSDTFVCFVVHRLSRPSYAPGAWLLSVARPKATDVRHARDGQDVRRTNGTPGSTASDRGGGFVTDSG